MIIRQFKLQQGMQTVAKNKDNLSTTERLMRVGLTDQVAIIELLMTNFSFIYLDFATTKRCNEKRCNRPSINARKHP